MPTHQMDTEEIRSFLTSQPAHIATLATVRTDGRPHTAPVWMALDISAADVDSPVGDIIFNTGSGTIKGKNLARDPRVSLCINDERPPFAFVTVEGIATPSEDVDEMLHWATILGGRYMGAEQAETFGRRNAVPDELLVRVRPTHIVAVADLSS